VRYEYVERRGRGRWVYKSWCFGLRLLDVEVGELGCFGADADYLDTYDTTFDFLTHLLLRPSVLRIQALPIDVHRQR
jgi:hypothetical protein